MKICLKYNLFWIKWAKVELLKLILSSVIAFLRKKVVVTFLRDRMMDFYGTKFKLFLIYVVMDLRVAISRFLCIRTFKKKKLKKMYDIMVKKSVFAMKKILTHKNLKIAIIF